MYVGIINFNPTGKCSKTKTDFLNIMMLLYIKHILYIYYVYYIYQQNKITTSYKNMKNSGERSTHPENNLYGYINL